MSGFFDCGVRAWPVQTLQGGKIGLLPNAERLFLFVQPLSDACPSCASKSHISMVVLFTAGMHTLWRKELGLAAVLHMHFEGSVCTDRSRAPRIHWGAQDDWLERVGPLIQARIERYAASEIRFNLMAVCADRRESLGAQLAALQARRAAAAGGPGQGGALHLANSVHANT